MTRVTRQEGHVIVAAVRVLGHREERPPKPEEVAALIGIPPEVLRLKAVALAELGILALVESAFDTHLEIRDHLKLEDLELEENLPALDDDLAAFEKRKQEEADKMSRLFSEGDHEKRRSERVRKMDEELRDFKKRKPRDPFGGEGGE